MHICVQDLHIWRQALGVREDIVNISVADSQQHSIQESMDVSSFTQSEAMTQIPEPDSSFLHTADDISAIFTSTLSNRSGSSTGSEGAHDVGGNGDSEGQAPMEV